MWMTDGILASTSWELKLNLWVFWDARVEILDLVVALISPWAMITQSLWIPFIKVFSCICGFSLF
jgi:hypothetical protein